MNERPAADAERPASPQPRETPGLWDSARKMGMANGVRQATAPGRSAIGSPSRRVGRWSLGPMNDDRDADLAFALLVLPLAVVLCVVVWAAIVWTVTRFGS